MSTKSPSSTGKWVTITLSVPVLLLIAWLLFIKTTFWDFAFDTSSQYYETLHMFPATGSMPAVELMRSRETGVCYNYIKGTEGKQGVAVVTACPI